MTPEDRKEYNKAYHDKNKDRAKELQKAYYEANREKQKAKSKQYRQQNLERRKQYEKAYREKHKERRSEYTKEYNIRNPVSFHVQKHRVLKNKYGITFGDYKRMWCEQKGCCAICERFQTDFKRALFVDHCHTTGKVRGLLCNDCNQGLGRFRDNLSTLDKAKEYLLKFRS